MKKLLITGSTGFVGSSLIQYLTKNFEVHAISAKIPKAKVENVIYHNINLFNKDKINSFLKLKKFRYLIHLAWETKPKKYLISKKNFKFFFYSTNLYYNFCKYGGRYALLIGSSAECDLKKKIISEKDYENTFEVSRYSLSKYLFYKNVEVISKIFKTKFLWSRIFWVYGKKQPRGKLISDLIFSIKIKKKYILRNMHDSINLMHVNDISFAIYKLFKSRITGIANIASKKNYKIKDIIKKKFNYKKNILLLNINRHSTFNKVSISKLSSICFKEKYKIEEEIKKYLNE
jgi:UDP-glucuronate decarboxylase